MSDEPAIATAEELAAALLERVRNLPEEPGVYLLQDAEGAVLYVGKAQNLRARVRQYLAGGDGRLLVHYLVPRIRAVEVVATRSVKDALLLENQLIKQHKPRFNVRLRDDKNYLALRLDPSETYPRFRETRRFKRGDSAAYFGPYTSSVSMRETLRSLQRIFPLRTCSDNVFSSYRRKGRPCIEHSVGRCSGPCCGLIDDPGYAELVTGAVRFMKGQSGALVRELELAMAQASLAEDFEQAARLRDRIQAIERTVERPAAVSPRFVDRDVFALASEGRRVEIQSLHVRQGRLLGGNAFGFHDLRLELEQVLDSFLAQFYDGDRELPQEVLVPFEVESREALEALWSERAGRAVRLLQPQRGERRQLLELAQHNAALALAERARRERTMDETLEELRQLLGLARAPMRIECYDTSHLQGSLHVASRVVFESGVAQSDAYRRYKLREAAPGDDYAALREVLGRRLARLEQDPAPDLLLLDGGKGQLSAVRALIADLGLEALPLAALAKEHDDATRGRRALRHGGAKREQVFLPGVKDPLLPAPDSAALLLLQRVRDESHRFALRYHRELRRKLGTKSILDELPGIGPGKRRALLRTLGSLERVKQASEDELAAVPKISRRDAALIARFFRAEPPAQGTPLDPVQEPERAPEDPVKNGDSSADVSSPEDR